MKNTRKTISYEFSSTQPQQRQNNIPATSRAADSDSNRESRILIALLILLFILLLAVSVLLWVSTEGGYSAAAAILRWQYAT